MDELFDLETEDQLDDINDERNFQIDKTISINNEKNMIDEKFANNFINLFEEGILHHANIFYCNKNDFDHKSINYIIEKIMTSKSNENDISLFRSGNHPDFMKISEEKEIDVEKIRAVRRFLSLNSSIANVKIVLINEIEKMNPTAANALLKMLEEPTKDTYFFMTSHNIWNVMQTILSRSMMHRMILENKNKKIDQSDILSENLFEIYNDKNIHPARISELIKQDDEKINFAILRRAILKLIDMINPMKREVFDLEEIYLFTKKFDDIMNLLYNSKIYNMDTMNLTHAIMIILRRKKY